MEITLLESKAYYQILIILSFLLYQDAGAISNLPHSEEIIPNLPLTKKRCLSNCINSNSAIVINHSDLHDIQLCQDESENATKPIDINIIEENDNKVEHSNFEICNHFNESENETPPKHSIPLAVNDNKDGLTSSHLGNTCESEQGSKLNNPESPVEIEDNDISHLFEVGKFSSESHTESQQNSSNSGKEFSGEDNNSDMRNNFMECTVHLLDVIIEEPGESLNASSDSLVSERSEPIPATKTERSVVKNEIVPKLTNQCKVPVQQFVPNIETDNKLDKCYSLEEEDISSDSSNNSMLRRLESDSDEETVERKYDSNVRVTGETQSLTYQEESCSTDLLHRSESLDNRCCETSFGTCDMESGARRYSNRRKCSRQPHDRKESLEQRLRRRFTISDEHKQEVAKRIIALVIKYSLFVFNFCSWVGTLFLFTRLSFCVSTNSLIYIWNVRKCPFRLFFNVRETSLI